MKCEMRGCVTVIGEENNLQIASSFNAFILAQISL